MRRFFAAPLIVFAIGVALIVLSVANVLPGMVGGGASLAFFAAVLFALSFIPRPETVGETPPMSTAESLLKIFSAPTEVFRNLRRYPRWLAPLLVMSILGTIYLAAFTQRVTPERIGNFMTDRTVESGFEIPPAQIAQMRESNVKQYKEPLPQISSAISGFAGGFVLFAFLAAIYLLTVLAMGGQINFWQALAATVYSWFPPMVLHRALSFIILFLRDPADLHPVRDQQTLVTDNLGALVTPADNPILWVLLSSIGLIAIYQLWLAATGLKNAGERVSGSAAWTAAVVVWLFAVAFGALAAALFPGFIS